MLANPKHIWLFHGYAGSGKDTAGLLLRDILGSQVVISSFASAVKDEVSIIYELDRTVLDSQEGKKKWLYFADGTYKQVRTLLIEHAQGQKAIYNNPAIWAERIIVPACNDFICTDWRFIEELEYIRKRFPESHIHTVRIVRSSVVSLMSSTEHELDIFPSEYTVENDGSLLYLSSQLNTILEHIHAKTFNV